MVNSIALLVLVSVNVLTPISYAQESEVLDSPSVTDVTAPLAGSETSNGENFSPRD
ncbi:hypothetical protein IJL65_00810 [bacterium]|nr:hypothetical protein [bacterium]